MNLREIDAKIAEHIMGWHVYFSDGEFVERDGTSVHDWRGRIGESSYRDWVPHYSTDIADAWQIVEKLHGYGIRIETGYDGKNRYRAFSYYNDSNISVRAETAPLVICLLALKSRGIEVPE